MSRIVAVTGGIGVGKSAVCGLLRNLGYEVLDADACAHKVLSEPHVEFRVKSIFGDKSYLPSGILNKDFIREAIFRNASLRAKMEAVVHPEVRRYSNERLHALAENSKEGWAFYEMALLFEAGRQKDFDAVVVVTANYDVRIARLVESRNLTVAQVEAIMASQVNDAERLQGAQAVINNSGSLDELRNSVETALVSLRAFFAESSF